MNITPWQSLKRFQHFLKLRLTPFLKECNLKHLTTNYSQIKLFKMYTRQGALVNKYLVHLVMKTETISEGVYRITNIYSTEIY